MATSALAQVPPASVQTAPTREEIERTDLTRPAPQGPRVTVEGDIERAPCPLADPAYANITVNLRDVSFANLGPVPAAVLRPAYEPYLGREAPIAVVCEIRDAAATILRREGYLAAVQVPTQRIEDGVVRFEVLMARVTAIRVRGDAGGAEQLLGSYLEQLTEQPVFNRYEAERYLLLARDLPGYDVRLALRPAGTAPGELIGDVIVTRRPSEVSFNIQNFGSKDVGRWGGQVSAQFYGLTGLGDRTTIAAFTTADFEEQQVLQLGHEFRVGPEGLTVSGGLTYAWTRPDIDGGVDVKADTFLATAELSYPFRRTQSVNLRGALGFDYIDQDVRFGGIDLSQDHLRVAYLRFDADAVDSGPQAARGLGPLVQPSWRLAGTFEARRGLDIFDASESCLGTPSPCLAPGFVPPSRLEADGTGTVFRASGLIEAQVTPDISVAFLPRAQYSPDALLSFEEFSAGNYTVGRGYDPGAIIGDSGVGMQAELRFFNLSRQVAPRLGIQPFVFVDSALVWNEDNSFDGLDPQGLTSVGAGVRAIFDNKYRLDVTLAVPTERAGFLAGKPDPRLLISFTTRLLPW